MTSPIRQKMTGFLSSSLVINDEFKRKDVSSFHLTNKSRIDAYGTLMVASNLMTVIDGDEKHSVIFFLIQIPPFMHI
jgi:hypothetical protein